jgi:hypothetical protein
MEAATQVQYRIYKNPHLVRILSKTNQLYIFTPPSLRCIFNVILPFMLLSQVFRPKFGKVHLFVFPGPQISVSQCGWGRKVYPGAAESANGLVMSVYIYNV